MKRILLVEDHATFREALATFLEEDPYFEVAAQVRALAEANGSPFAEADVAIIDLYLPDGEGIDWSSTYEKKLLT